MAGITKSIEGRTPNVFVYRFPAETELQTEEDAQIDSWVDLVEDHLSAEAGQ